MTLRDDFKAEIESAIDQCCDLGYHPTRFQQMILEKHPVEVAKRFVTSSDFQHGFKELNKMGRPELTVEGIMIKEKYKTLFSPSERQSAQWRLDNWDK